MNSESSVFGWLGTCLCITIIAVSLTISSCSKKNTEQLAQMVNNGADPLAVKCMVDGQTSDDSPVCVALAMRGGSK